MSESDKVDCIKCFKSIRLIDGIFLLNDPRLMFCISCLDENADLVYASNVIDTYFKYKETQKRINIR